MTTPETPEVYARIAAVSAEMASTGISKNRNNAQQGYKFRGIDDVYNALAPLLSKHGLVIIPRILSREVVERQTKTGGTLNYVTVEAEFDFVAVSDASHVTARSYGEAMDSADKATNKAMSAAYKYTAFQTFCIPTEGDNDADGQTHDVQPKAELAAVVGAPKARVARTWTPTGAPTLRVLSAKVVKTGQSGKGPWTLHAVKFSDGREATTFSSTVYGVALEALESGQEVAVTIIQNNGKASIDSIELVFAVDGDEPPPFMDNEPPF